MARAKPKDASEHHGAFGRMRLQYEGVWTRGNGAKAHRFEFTCHHGYRWQKTAAAKIEHHLISVGYEIASSIDKNDATGRPSSRSRVYRRGVDEVHIAGWIDRDGTEHVYRVEHYWNGIAGDDRRPRITLDQVISAMSWGCA